MKYKDIHNHTIYSDGDNTILDIIERATRSKFIQIGTSDHYEAIQEIERYVNEVLEYRAEHLGIDILVGVEIKAKTLLGLELKQIQILDSKLDYLLIEDIEYNSRVQDALNRLQPILNFMKCKKGWAHIDLERLGSARDKFLHFIKMYFKDLKVSMM